MAAPVPGAVTSAAQLAQQKLQQDPAAQRHVKTQASKFDQVMAQRADQAQGVQAPARVGRTDAVAKTQHVNKAERATLNRLRPDAVTTKAAPRVAQTADTSPVTKGMMKMMSSLEQGQGVLDKLVRRSLSGKKLSNNELLGLQAQMYSYTQELELTGKVVEKATTGLKDTLKTQV